jgi:hypothetical protein
MGFQWDKQLWQLGDIRRDPPSLIFREKLRRFSRGMWCFGCVCVSDQSAGGHGGSVDGPEHFRANSSAVAAACVRAASSCARHWT